MTTTGQSTATQLEPYIFFYGRCQEALDFYKAIFGGEYEVMPIAGSPMEEHAAENFRDKIMHASFKAPAIRFMCSDGREAKTVDPEAGNISLAWSASDYTEGERVFESLAKGGKIDMPLADAFWGGKFGQLTDKFGTEWMITTP